MINNLLLIILSLSEINPDINNEFKNSLNRFSFDFLKTYQSITDENENLLYSPFSLVNSLSLFLSGSEGDTKKELNKLLNFEKLNTNYTLELAFKKLKEKMLLNDFENDHLFFKSANNVLLKKNIQLKEEFKFISDKAYGAKISEADFKNNYNEIKNSLNKWISKETNNNIKDISMDIDDQTIMLYINIIYFKAKWLDPFPTSHLRIRDFTNNDGEIKSQEFMTDLSFYNFGIFDKYKILQLDYFNNCSMFIVLPHEKNYINNLIKDLDFDQLSKDLKNLKTAQLEVKIPKFKIESQINMKNILKKSNIETLFNEKANLSKMTDFDNLFVSDIIQNTFFKINEDGTEAGATTTYKLSSRSLFYGDEFDANYPFLFFVQLNGVNIFTGSFKKS